MTRKKQQPYINGTFTHRRTESDYMGTLLDAVTLEDWREIITYTVAAAKSGDPSARTFLAQYLVGKPDLKAPTPVTVVVQQLSGRDPLADKLAYPHIRRLESPSMYEEDDWKDAVRAGVVAELQALEAQKSNAPGSGENADSTTLAAEKSRRVGVGSPIDYGKI